MHLTNSIFLRAAVQHGLRLLKSTLRFPLALHPRDVVADFIVFCVVAHWPINCPAH
jgi:hypothetical protein